MSTCRVAGSLRNPAGQPGRPARTTGQRFVVAACVLAALALAAPSAASAARYLSNAKVIGLVRGLVRANAVAHVDTVSATCWPTGRKHTRHNLRFRWDMWDCSWSAHLSRSDGSTGRCSGTIRITGRRHGFTHHAIHSGHCAQLTGPTTTPTPSPTPPRPAPTPAPTPTPTPESSRHQQMIDEAIRFGVQRGVELIQGSPTNPTPGSGAFYFGQLETRECVFLNATRLRCPMYMWWEGWMQDARTFLVYPTRDIDQAFVFVEDLGTSVGFNDLMEPDNVLDFEITQAYWRLCSDWYAGYAACPQNRWPPAYPPPGHYPQPPVT